MRRLVEFVVIAFGFSWAVAGAYRAVGGGVSDPAFTAVAVVYMFGPLVAASAVQIRRGERVAPAVGARLTLNRWLVVAWLTPAVVAVLAVVFAVAHPEGSLATSAATVVESYGPSLSAERAAALTESLEGVPLSFVIGSILVTGLIAGATVNAVAAFGEEAGWRGLMLYELRDESFWRSSAIVGLTWGVWHLPLVAQGYNYPSNPAVGVFAMVAFTLLATPPLNYVRLKSGTVIAPSVFHGTVNATVGVSVVAVAGVSRLVTGAGVATMAALATVNVVMVVYDRLTGDGVTSSRLSESLDV
jgi:membrane protease YdiL (CAAX protease family)